MKEEEVVTWCDDCPDRVGCLQGWACDVVKMVHRTCAEQGVPVKVTDPEVLQQVAILLNPRCAGSRGRTPGRP